ncbi:Aspercryptin biosynthesis cluster-specific transcription regulator atnN-like protein [Cladobotryum mycophilum]|uniref:Aspercryptin biosynthesis cluster-specific transcription regulator atnN-like protein n=1 Tax=Cladobotryum mycophilum TaxID=491253 RepID=A0ABR0STC0_9HYPO
MERSNTSQNNNVSRLGHRKVKTGCVTCKKRRVKCDEAKPACQRCISTGRVCDGYGIWGGGGNAYDSAERTGSSAPSKLLLPRRTNMNHIRSLPCSAVSRIAGRPEGIGYEYFRYYTNTKLPGVFESDFWESLVFQASAQEPAVLHAITALGAAHKDEERIALVEYNKAIGHMRRHLERSDREGLRVALITCMLFVCYELLNGGFKTGYAHLHSGLHLLQKIQSLQGITSSDGPVILRPKAPAVEDALVEAFSRLNIQAALFGQVSTYIFQVGQDAKTNLTYDVPLVFETFRDARQHLDALINGVYTLTSQASDLLDSRGEIPDCLYSSQYRLELALEQWLKAFDRGEPAIRANASFRTAFGIPLLRIYHVMAKIMAATSLRGTDEMIYDRFTGDFRRLVMQAKWQWDRMTCAVRDRVLKHCYPLPKVRFTADMGLVPPLNYVALKCRCPNTRRQAINLLLISPHREGGWDGSLPALMAKHLMDMEEGNIYKGTDLWSLTDGFKPWDEASSDSLPIVPASKRVSDVSVTLPDNVGGQATMVCKRHLGNGEWETTKAHFEITFETPAGACVREQGQ